MSKKKKLIRRHFRETSLERDDYRCVMCRAPDVPVDDLDVHHITDRNEMPGGGYVKENGISLCPPCHLKAEQWHISDHESWAPGYHPDELYEKIGSSYEAAVAASEKYLL